MEPISITEARRRCLQSQARSYRRRMEPGGRADIGCLIVVLSTLIMLALFAGVLYQVVR
jgi:hypothetical protein